MIKLKVDGISITGSVTGRAKDIVKEACVAVEGLHRAMADCDAELGELFKDLFYTLADQRAFFNDSESDSEDDKKDPEEVLRDNLMKHMKDTEKVEKIVEAAKQIAKAMFE